MTTILSQKQNGAYKTGYTDGISGKNPDPIFWEHCSEYQIGFAEGIKKYWCDRYSKRMQPMDLIDSKSKLAYVNYLTNQEGIYSYSEWLNTQNAAA